MKRDVVLALIALGAGILLTRECFPRREEVEKPVPIIVTQYDTVRDTVRIRGPRVVTTDTVQLIIRETFHDTAQIVVEADTSQRSNLWPMLNVQVGDSIGATTLVTTFSLRSGRPATIQIWTPGPLLSIWADSMPAPRVLFGQPLKRRGASLWAKGKLILGGIGVGIVFWEVVR